MLSFFSSWVLSIIAMVFIGVVADLLISNNKLQGVVKTTIAIFSVLILLQPLKNIDISKINFLNSSIEVNSQFIKTYQNIKIEKLTQDIQQALNNSGYQNVNLTINLDEKDIINSICVDLSKLVLISEEMNINKYTNIIEIIKQFVTIKEGQIIFYE